jgi:ribosomal protein S18 acetylase RimI-like enzyme
MALSIREYRVSDLETILDIAVAAWQPIFASSKQIVGDELFDLTHPDPDERKRASVTRACASDDPTQVWIAEQDDTIAGFITITLDRVTLVGEIGNNAVSRAFQGRGIGTQMYRFALDQMRQAGMKSAVVTTGGDEAHGPARRAYEKVGFSGPVPSIEYHIKI